VLVSDRIVELLQREGAEFVVGFPENRLLNSAALRGIRPIITRTERVAVNIADGFARATDGERLLPCVTQYGPGVESAFGAVAQAFGDRSPILLLLGEHEIKAQGSTPGFLTERAYEHVTRWSATLNDGAHGPEVFRRALNALRGPRNGPVLVAIANDVLNGDAGEADWAVRTTLPKLTQASSADVAETASRLLEASNPVILAGQGVLYARASAELVALAERTGIPVATTLNGKSAFPENHPLSLGTAARTRPATVDWSFAPTSSSASGRASPAPSTSRRCRSQRTKQTPVRATESPSGRGAHRWPSQPHSNPPPLFRKRSGSAFRFSQSRLRGAAPSAERKRDGNRRGPPGREDFKRHATDTGHDEAAVELSHGSE
jgi:Thiamine pyrophosphate enzyme, N-terminal TPP binding domain/Thiamine pyrophosphate enzyme, central domain